MRPGHSRGSPSEKRAIAPKPAIFATYRSGPAHNAPRAAITAPSTTCLRRGGARVRGSRAAMGCGFPRPPASVALPGSPSPVATSAPRTGSQAGASRDRRPETETRNPARGRAGSPRRRGGPRPGSRRQAHSLYVRQRLRPRPLPLRAHLRWGSRRRRTPGPAATLRRFRRPAAPRPTSTMRCRCRK
jgi:hypothetical protein